MPDRRVLIGLIALGVASRAAAVLVLQSHAVPHSTYEHGEIAANLLAGRGFSVRFLGADGPTSQQAPLYPLMVAGAYAIGGVGTPRSLLVLELGQALLGGVAVGLVMILAGEVAPRRPRIAILAGLIAAAHPTMVYAATHVQVASLAVTLLAGCLAWAYRAGRTGSIVDAVAAGGFLGGLALADPILGLAAPGMAWAIAIGQGPRPIGPIGRGGRDDRRALRRPVGRAERPGPRRVRADQELLRLCVLAGELPPLSLGTDKVVRASVDRAPGPPVGHPPRLERRALGRPTRGRLPRRHRPDPRRLSRARAGSPSPSDRGRSSDGHWPTSGPTPGAIPGSASAGSAYFVLFDETNPEGPGARSTARATSA